MDRSARLVKDVTDVAVSALTAGSAANAMRAVTETLRVLIGADNVLFHEFERGGWSGIHGIAPSSAWESLPLHGAPTAELGSLHPAVSHVTRHHVPKPFALTDWCPNGAGGERRWSACSARSGAGR